MRSSTRGAYSSFVAGLHSSQHICKKPMQTAHTTSVAAGRCTATTADCAKRAGTSQWLDRMPKHGAQDEHAASGAHQGEQSPASPAMPCTIHLHHDYGHSGVMEVRVRCQCLLVSCATACCINMASSFLYQCKSCNACRCLWGGSSGLL